MTRRGESITLSVSPNAKQGLEALALKLGYKWGNKPNISALVEAIGTGDISLLDKTDENLRIQALAETPQVKEFLRLLKTLEK